MEQIYDDQLEEIDKVLDIFCKELLGFSEGETNGMAGIEGQSDSRKGEDGKRAAQYWQQIICVDIQNSVRQCYEWRKLI